MSFILDALKKSESDRQRQSGPALFEVKVAAPRTRLPARDCSQREDESDECVSEQPHADG